MLSHDNLVWTAQALRNKEVEKMIEEGFSPRGVSYLPLSHVAAQFSDIFVSLKAGGHIFFTDADAMKGTLIDYLLEVRPTAFLGVPRVWEKMEERVRSVLDKKKRIFAWASHVKTH
jgi:long-chain-fatty-acid--CoA ligase ACSBG